MNKKMTTPDAAAPMGRWCALAARCLNPGVTLSSRLRNALFVLFIGGILAYGAGFAWYMLAHFDLINLIRDVSDDDAFYYFQIAYHLAEGKFSTFDGGITRTNGYHPLWLFLITPFYWVFDKEAALFGIKAFEIMLIAGGVALVTAAARLARMPWYLMFAALPMLYQHHALIVGTEAAAALFMLGLFILAACLFARSPARWKWPLAAVAFALPWVRLEYIAISLAVTAALCWIEWSWRERAGHRAREGRSVLAMNAVAPLLAAVAGILVYFAYNGLVFGGIVPVSGATKQAWSQAWWEHEGGYSFVQNFRDILQIPFFDYKLLLAALEVCACVVLVYWFARRSRSREDWLLLAFLIGVFGLAAGHLAKFAQTVLTIHPFQAGWSWYFVPAYLLMTLIVPVNCGVAIHFIRRFIGPRSSWAANILSVGIVLAGAVFLFAKANFTEPFQWAGQRIKTLNLGVWHLNAYSVTLVANRVLPEDSVLGSWDAGTIGYFSRFPVVNLDGLVNSYDYLRARNLYPYWQARKEVTEAALYQRYGVTHFANHYRVSRHRDALLFEGPPYQDRYSKHQIKFWPAPSRPEMSSGGINRSDWFWWRMEPHFDYQSDGVGLIVDGRLVQTFAKECDPDELVVWPWAGLGDGTVASAWTQTQTGLCVTAAVLPHTISSPVRFETMSERDILIRLTGGNPPVIRSDWDVYLAGNSLIYVKEPCIPEDVEPRFFLHLDPVDRNDLPIYRKLYGFDNLDFTFRDHRSPIEGRVCVAIRELPDYAIAAIRTGQFTGEGRVWEGNFTYNSLSDKSEALHMEDPQ